MHPDEQLEQELDAMFLEGAERADAKAFQHWEARNGIGQYCKVRRSGNPTPVDKIKTTRAKRRKRNKAARKSRRKNR